MAHRAFYVVYAKRIASAPNQDNLNTDAPRLPASNTAINTSAHQANGTLNTSADAPPTTNGHHTAEKGAPLLFDPVPREPAEVDSQPASSILQTSDQAIPEDSTPSTIAQVPNAAIDPTPPILQQPTSDAREEPGPPFPLESTAPPSGRAESPENQSASEIQISGSEMLESSSAPTDASIADKPAALATFNLLEDSVLQGGDAQTPSLEGSTAPKPAETEKEKASQNTADAPLDSSQGPTLSDAETAIPLTEMLSPTGPMASQDNALGSEAAADTGDQFMQDVPASPAKVARPREEDDSVEVPLAKRTKTEEAEVGTEFKVPDRPMADTQTNGSTSADARQTSAPMTKPQQKHLQRMLGNVKRITAAKSFLEAVDPVALNIPTYPEIIKNPMDLKKLDNNLRNDKYNTVDEFMSDFNLIVQNALSFNGPTHGVTTHAMNMKASFEKHLEGLPSAEIKEPAPSKKKAPDPMAIRAPPARRESRSSLPGSARSPVSAGSPQTFALGPEGIPLIRRDSTVDGRPKREIHRPAPRDLPYTHQKPKKKKFQWELKFCDHVLKEISKPKWQQYSLPFMVAVDPVALNIPTYLNVVKKPMDFGTIRQKLDRGEYENAKEFETDARQVFKNCYLFNPEGDSINILGHRFESVFNDEWCKKREWLEENTPSSGQRSPVSSGDEESEEEDEEEEEEDGQMEIVSKLQKQIAEMSKQVEMITGASKKNKTPPVVNKKAPKSSKAPKKETKKAATAPAKVERKAAPKPSKKEKTPYVTYEQKQDISSRINSLSESKMSQALSIIRSNMPNLQGVQEDELELDIDELSNDVLYKLLTFVRKHAPRPDDSPIRAIATGSTAAPARKKNKPMSKHEQEARIARVQSGLSAFQKGGGGSGCKCLDHDSPVPADLCLDGDVQPSIENQGSDDEDDEDSESEEE